MPPLLLLSLVRTIQLGNLEFSFMNAFFLLFSFVHVPFNVLSAVKKSAWCQKVRTVTLAPVTP